MGSAIGNAILWVAAGSGDVQNLKMFATPEKPGFGGRQAFSKGDDQFFKAMASVTTAASALAADYDEHRKSGQVPEHAVCILPIIVVEGPLFESFYDTDSNEMRIEAASHVRCHWKGAPKWDQHATIDIVTLDSLPKYLEEMGPSLDGLLGTMMRGLKSLRSAFESGSLEPLDFYPGSRGMVGLHPILGEVLGSTNAKKP